MLDVETTGIHAATSCILQIGWLLKLGDDRRSGVLFLQTPENVLERYDSSDYVQKCVRQGNHGYVKSADVRAYGLPREFVFQRIAALYDAVVASGGVLLGHNLLSFDTAHLEWNAQMVGVRLAIDRSRCVDTGSLIKASKLGELPASTERDDEFYCRIRNVVAKGIFWNLAEAVRYLGLPVDTSMAHDAGHDVMMTAAVYDEICRRIRYFGLSCSTSAVNSIS